MRKVFAILIAIVSVLATSLGGQYFTGRTVSSEWYKCIKPQWTPPSIVFPIVWTTLYILIAIAFARILIADDRIASGVLAVNLVFNIIWCYFFFAAKKPWYAIPSIVIIWLSIIWLQWHRRKDRIFVALLTPYLLWISFATVLNLQAALNSSKKCTK